MGKLRTDVERLIRLLPDPQGQAVGLVPTTYQYPGTNGTVQYGYQLETAGSGGAKQNEIQFQDEGINLGAAGTVATFNVVGTTLTATRVGNALTLTSTATANTGTVTSVSGSGGTTGLTLTGGPITTTGTLTIGGTLAIANGGTGQVTANAALNALLPAQAAHNTHFLQTDGTNTAWAAGGTGTVTSVSGSGGTTGLTLTGGPITTTGTLTLGGTLAIANGGTGQTAKTDAFDALAPTTTKGDLIIHNGTDNVRKGVGTNGQIPQADSSVAEGITWVTSPFVPYLTLSAQILALSPMAFWKLNETSGTTFADSSGNAYNLTLNLLQTLAAHYMIPSITNEKFAYWGTNTSAVASRSGSLGFTNPITGSWSVHLIAAFANPGVNVDVIRIGGIGTGGSANNAQLIVRFGSGAVLQAFWHQGANVGVTVSSLAAGAGFLANQVGQPWQVLVVKDAAAQVVHFYVNGREVFIGTAYSTEPTGGGTSAVTLGNSIQGTQTKSTFGYVAVWNTALTADNARDLALAAGMYGT